MRSYGMQPDLQSTKKISETGVDKDIEKIMPYI